MASALAFQDVISDAPIGMPFMEGMGAVFTGADTVTGAADLKRRVRATLAPGVRAIFGPISIRCSAPGLSATGLPAGRATPSASLRIRITPPSIDMVWISARVAAAVSTATSRSSAPAVRVT
jgi:hypothetical protein